MVRCCADVHQTLNKMYAFCDKSSLGREWAFSTKLSRLLRSCYGLGPKAFADAGIALLALC